MNVIKKTVDNVMERKITIGAIVSTEFLRELVHVHDMESLMLTPYARNILRWCREYHEKYEKAPGKHMQDIFRRKKKELFSEEDIEMTSSFLSRISKEHEDGENLNSKYLMDLTLEYLKKRSLHKLSDDIKDSLDKDDALEAEKQVFSFKKTDANTHNGVNPLTDSVAIQNAFEEEKHNLITYPGALGEMVNDQFCRDCFIGIMAPEKRGKTFYMMDIGFQALRCRCNVAYFSVGDMSQNQMIRRQHGRIAGRVLRQRQCGKFAVPVLDCKKNQDNQCERRQRRSKVGAEIDGNISPEENFGNAPKNYSPCTYCMERHPEEYVGAVWYEVRVEENPLTWREGLKEAKRFMSRCKNRELRLYTYPSKSMSVKGINNVLHVEEDRDGFVPDVVLIDYADILAPEDPRKDFRHQQNETWMGMRAMSQERHNLVISATQSDSSSYEVETLKMSNFSEDKRKFSHVTGMLGLNQTEDEKRMGIMRANWIVLREDEFFASDSVSMLQCLRINRPIMGSFKTFNGRN